MVVEKNDIIRHITVGLHRLDYVQAFWIEGSDAMGTADELSDLDLWFDVSDGLEEAFIAELQEILAKISPLDYVYRKKHSHPKIRQVFFHLQDTSPFLIIDVCVQSHSRKVEFVLGHVDEMPRVIFDKAEVISYRKLDRQELKNILKNRILELEKTFLFFAPWVDKEIRRDNFLEALNYYHLYVLKPLVELCRICYQPTKKDFYLKHIRQDLPKDVVLKMEELFAVTSNSEIAAKTSQATEYFQELLVFARHKYVSPGLE